MHSLSTSVYVILIQHVGAATEGHIHKCPRRDQELIGSAHSTPGTSRMYQHHNYPPRPNVSEPPQLASHVRTPLPVTYGGDSYPRPLQGELWF